MHILMFVRKEREPVSEIKKNIKLEANYAKYKKYLENDGVPRTRLCQLKMRLQKLCKFSVIVRIKASLKFI